MVQCARHDECRGFLELELLTLLVVIVRHIHPSKHVSVIYQRSAGNLSVLNGNLSVSLDVSLTHGLVRERW